jgi:hypothetical protein
LTPGGSSTVHIYAQTVHKKPDNGTYITIKKNWEVRPVPPLCELYPGIYLITEEKAWKNLSYGSQKLPRYPGGSSPVHTNNTQSNTMRPNTQNGTS